MKKINLRQKKIVFILISILTIGCMRKKEDKKVALDELKPHIDKLEKAFKSILDNDKNKKDKDYKKIEKDFTDTKKLIDKETSMDRLTADRNNHSSTILPHNIKEVKKQKDHLLYILDLDKKYGLIISDENLKSIKDGLDGVIKWMEKYEGKYLA